MWNFIFNKQQLIIYINDKVVFYLRFRVKAHNAQGKKAKDLLIFSIPYYLIAFDLIQYFGL